MSNLLQSNERSIRSVFVGNIPYDATEEKLKDIFNEVGPVVSFRLVYDRETGKPKGYGFCEYRDQETAMSAMRNLNGYELNNRILRVDNAANEKTKEEIRNLQTSVNGIFESPYGPEMDPEQAPEEISKVVASLPPEQMFELAKQMKQCIATNPTEARNMLIQNPQLCYGLLQALVVMRVVDSNVALKMLHRTNPPIKPLKADTTTVPPTLPPQMPNLQPPQLGVPPQLPPNIAAGAWPTHTDQFGRTIPASVLQQTVVNQTPVGLTATSTFPSIPPSSVINTASTQSSFDPRMYNRMQNLPANNLDPRVRQGQPTNAITTNAASLDPRQYAQQQQNASRANNNNTANRNTGPPTSQFNLNNQMPPQLPPQQQQAQQSNEDQEKTELIMRVLQLTDAQIAQLPPEQRQSVLLLRQQIQASNTISGTT